MDTPITELLKGLTIRHFFWGAGAIIALTLVTAGIWLCTFRITKRWR